MKKSKFIKTSMFEFLNEQNEVLLAPNGKQSNLSKNLYEYVRTDEFKVWFGDWENNPQNSSKIVDENGEPMLVYHGTKKLFHDFDRNQLRLNYFYFAKNKDYANKFGDVKSCFLNVRKIKDCREVGVEKITIPKLFKTLNFKTENLEYKHLYGQKKIKDKFWQYIKYYDEIYNVLKWNGYDCINFFEDYVEDNTNDVTEVFAIFNSNQIKCVLI